MKKLHLFFFLTLLITGLVFVTSCKEEEDPELELESMMAGEVDLNAATSPTDVTVSPTITITFTTDVDATTATTDYITLVQEYDDTEKIGRASCRERV